MDNFFITRHFDWAYRPSRKVRLLNALLRGMGYSVRFTNLTATGEMNSVEQRINIYHLLSQLLVFGVPGDIVEFGSYEGQSAALLRMTADRYDPARRLHVYDAFAGSALLRFQGNFNQLGLALPVIHRGVLPDTVVELPERICFAHIDISPGPTSNWLDGTQIAPGATIRRVLEGIYSRMSLHGIILLNDYWLPEQTEVLYQNATVRATANAFFADKPEEIVCLHGGNSAHAFVCKLADQDQNRR